MMFEFQCKTCGDIIPMSEIDLELHSLTHGQILQTPAQVKVIEFGRAVCNVTNTDDPEECAKGIDRVWENYQKTKAKAFPDWDGLMELVAEKCPLCGLHTVYGWKADVPERYVSEKYRKVI